MLENKFVLHSIFHAFSKSMLLEEFRMTLRMWRKRQDHQICQVPIEFPVMTEIMQSADRSKADFSVFFTIAEQADCFKNENQEMTAH